MKLNKYVFTKNIKTIRDYKNNFLPMIEKSDYSPYISPYKDDRSVVGYKYKINEDEIYLNSLKDISATSRKIVETYVQNKTKKVLLLFCIDINLILKFTQVQSCYEKIYLIIPDPKIFYSFLHYADYSELLKSKVFCPIIYSDVDLLAKTVQANLEHDKVQYSGYDICHIYPYKKIFAECYRRVIDDLTKLIKISHLSLNTKMGLGKFMFENEIRNIKYLLFNPSNSFMEGIGVGKPVVCVAAGPSLNNNIEFLKKIQKEVFIIAVASVLKPLLKHNIRPDLVTVVDMQEEVWKYFDGLKKKDIPIVMAESSVYYKVVERLNKQVIISPSSSYSRKINRDLLSVLGIELKTIVGAAFSVAFSSILVARYMGVSKIILLGQDLAFGKESNYVSGASFESGVEYGKQGDTEYIKYKNFDTEEYIYEIVYKRKGVTEDVYVSEPFDRFRIWLEDVTRDLKLDIVNCSEGVYINNMEHMPLEKAYKKYIKGTEKFQLNYPKYNYNYTKFNHRVKRIEGMLKNFKQLKVYCLARMTTLKKIQKYIENKSKNRDAIFFKYLTEINDSFKVILKKFGLEVDYIAENDSYLYFLFKNRRDQSMINLTEEEKLVEVKEINQLYYEYIIDGVNYYLPIMEQLIKDLKRFEIKSKKI